MKEQDYKSNQGGKTAWEAVKTLLRPFVLLGWTFEKMCQVPYSTIGDWYIRIGGEIQDEQGSRPLPQQIAAIQTASTHWEIFDAAEIIADIRREEAKKSEPARTSGEHCRFCGKTLEVKTGTGRNRHYCNDTCRIADFRRRRRDSHSAALVQQQTEKLHEMWKDPRISSQCFTMLYELFEKYGAEVAHVATEAVLAVAHSEQAGPEPEQARAQGCLFCGKKLSANSRTTRHYCNERCRVADFRRREAEAARAALLQQSQLPDSWQEHHIGGQPLVMLQTILVEYGEEAARDASEAVFQYLWEQNRRAAEPSRPATKRRKRR